MSLTRRNFVRAGTAATVLSAIPGSSLVANAIRRGASTVDDRVAEPTDNDRMKVLALKAIDAAKSAGATYADVRISRIVSQGVSTSSGVEVRVRDEEQYGIGVRALVGGYWGFASSPYWEDRECTQLAQSAVAQAKANTRTGERVVDWVPAPSVTGAWTSRGTDPFTVTIEEKVDFLSGWELIKIDNYLDEFRFTPGLGGGTFSREDWFLASTEGTAVAQTLFTTQGGYEININYRDPRRDFENGGGHAKAVHAHRQRGGWEVILNAKYEEQIPAMIERAVETMGLRPVLFDVGRFDVVFDAGSTAGLLGRTFGVATQLDRALGYEANASGTSYLGPDPYAYLGGAAVASPLITLDGNRSLPWGIATVQWDHDGVVPTDFPILKDGVLVNYQTTREQASWLKDWYTKRNTPVQSFGCAWTPSASDLPMQHIPNLVMSPGKNEETFDSLVAGIKRGVAVMGANPRVDFQAKNGIIARPRMREIINGKLGNLLTGGGILFNSTELWKNVIAIGGAGSVQPFTGTSTKGQPEQSCSYSLTTVPMVVKNVSIIDVKRRA